MTEYTERCKKCGNYPVQKDGICVNCHEDGLQKIARAYTEKELISMVQEKLSSFSLYIRALSRKDSMYNDMAIDIMDKIIDIRRLIPDE